MSWKAEVINSRSILTTGGGQLVDITDMEYDTSLVGYSALSLKLDIESHKHFVDCNHCNRKLQAYTYFRGFILCEKCVAKHHLAETAETINNPWFDFLAGIINPKLQMPVI